MSRVDDAYRRLQSVAPETPQAESTDATSEDVLERYVSEGNGSDGARRRMSAARVTSSRPVSRREPERGRTARPAVYPSVRPDRDAGGLPDDGVISPQDLEFSSSLTRNSPTTLMWGAARVLTRRKWLLLASFLVAFAAGTTFLRSVKPTYRATTRLTLDGRTPADALLKTAGDGAPQQGYLETMAEVLRSRSVAETVASRLALWQQPEYAPLAAGATPAAGAPAPEAVIGALMARTTVSPVPGSTVLNVAVDSGDPELAAKTANAIAQVFIERDVESRLSGAKDANNWIGRQLEEQRARVTETEAALQKYRETQNAASLDERQNIVVQRLSDLNVAVTKARTERIAKEALVKQVEGLKDQQDLLDTVPAVASNAYIQQLKAQVDQLDRELQNASVSLGEKHPEIIRLTEAIAQARRRLSDEIATVAASLRNDYLTAQAQEQSLTTALEQQKAEAQALDRKGVDYAALVREAESNRALYQNLLAQAKTLGLSSELQSSNVRVLDPATPPRTPVNPIGRLVLLLSAIGSLIFAAGMVFVVEYVDPRMRTLDDVPDQLGLPLLGYLEQLRNLETTVAADNAPPRFRAAVDRIRVSVEGQTGQDGGVLLVTSAAPKEGKTFVACNLAAGLALAGRRVLLVDCDLRRSRVHQVFGLKAQPGLASALTGAGGVSWTAVVQPGPCAGLSILTSGPAPTNAAELFSRQQFVDFLAQARQSFDWVVIDSPPAMAVADAQVLSRLADGVMFVTAADLTRREAARLAIAQLRRARGAPLMGAVLNRVAVPRWGAFYSPYYDSAYDSYYASSTPPQQS